MILGIGSIKITGRGIESSELSPTSQFFFQQLIPFSQPSNITENGQGIPGNNHLVSQTSKSKYL